MFVEILSLLKIPVLMFLFMSMGETVSELRPPTGLLKQSRSLLSLPDITMMKSNSVRWAGM
jgi:hypothetical protein